jgi:sugar/nucleoside kinase (ribokinase family)
MKDPIKASEVILEMGVNICLITLSQKGLIASWGDTNVEMPAFQVETVDQTGAGDAFCAGVIDSLLESSITHKNITQITTETMKSLLLRGSAAGAACVTTTGATPGVTETLVDSLVWKEGTSVWAEARIH